MATQVKPKALAADFKEAAAARNEWHIEVGDHVTVDDVLAPDFWRDVAIKLREWDRVEVRSESGRWFGEFIVRGVGHLYANVVLLRKKEFEDAILPKNLEDTGFTVRFVKTKGHQVIRISDKSVLKEGFATAVEAANWILSTVKPAKSAA